MFWRYSVFVLWMCNYTFLQLFTHILTTSTDRVSYDGYTLMRFKPSTQKEVDMLKSLLKSKEFKIDYWNMQSRINASVDIMVSPNEKESFKQAAKEKGISWEVAMDDVERYLKPNSTIDSDVSFRRVVHEAGFFEDYQDLKHIHGFLDGLARDHPEVASVISIGKSYEGRDLKVLKVGISCTNCTTKKAIWIDGLIHAREWIGYTTVTYVAYKLITNYKNDTEVKGMLEDFDWYFLPVVNTDGYEYSRNVDRLWRKNRRKLNNTECIGVDLNRNYGFHWERLGSSADPCDQQVYAGPTAFSEPESRAMRDFILKEENIIAYFTIHSYSQMFLSPWGWTNNLPPTYDDLNTLAKIATDAIKKDNGTVYPYGTVTELLYPGSGGSDDWAYGGAKIPYSYTIELRDTQDGFLAPREQIVPIAKEIFVAFRAISGYLTKNRDKLVRGKVMIN